MDIDLVFKIAAEQAMLVSLAGLVTTMMLLVREISSLFDLVKSLFGF